MTRLARTSSTTDTMDVGLGVLGKIVVDNAVDVGDIETTSSNVGSDEDLAGTGTELVQGTETGRL